MRYKPQNIHHCKTEASSTLPVEYIHSNPKAKHIWLLKLKNQTSKKKKPTRCKLSCPVIHIQTNVDLMTSHIHLLFYNKLLRMLFHMSEDVHFVIYHTVLVETEQVLHLTQLCKGAYKLIFKCLRVKKSTSPPHRNSIVEWIRISSL